MLYFLVRGVLGFIREGYRYLLSAWRLLGICKLALAASVCGLHLSRCITAKQQWASYVKHPRDAFTDFHPLARQSQMYTVMSALLLFILVLKVREEDWSRAGLILRYAFIFFFWSIISCNSKTSIKLIQVHETFTDPGSSRALGVTCITAALSWGYCR